MMQSKNPATGEVLAQFDEISPAQVEDKLARAHAAFQRHRRAPFAERAAAMRRAGEILERDKQRFAALMTQEMGKTLKSAVAEAEKCASVCRYYAEHAEHQLADEVIATDAAQSYTRCLPLGPVLAVMPWNFPFWQVFRFAAPALMAGNVGLLKHASNVPQCARALEDVLRSAGFADGVFQTLLIGASRVAAIIDDPRVAAVTLTGSEGAGAQVGAAAGKALKKCVLELGGSDPFIVLPSANLDDAAAMAVKARCINNGQSCIAAKRFIVHEAVYDAFTRKFVAGLERLRVGDPMADDTDVGPLATEQVLADVTRQVADSVAAGARLLCGGQRIGTRGNFYAPTALADIPATAPAYREEVFGPVASLFKVEDTGAAIALANATPFGLGSSVWTTDPAEQRRLIDELDAGQTFVNAMVASDPRLPFGGVKRSGHGRELSAAGIREFVNLKTVYLAR
ncbi:MAG TPA: NAD-dependent succinate-semialdehyde dehydrogenase [Kofleriaceae bacterium]|jgi:succinate-semialdehyde dehydrogenase/glutarate-semialdehyde dehydrogenase|nr:NAD-dependent succinate-semialdehyde dehydrogenase [Kofleriaceae bacterium]